jgi:phytoene desaturase
MILVGYMNRDKTAIIIGAGIAGITTSIYLARKGFHVAVYEKNAFPGGRCSQMIRDGHRFDLGATIFLMPEIYRRVFSTLGLSIDECFDSKPLPTLYKLHFGDGTSLSFTTDQALLKKELEQVEKGSYEKSRQLLKSGYHLFQLATDHLLAKNFYRLTDFITPGNALLLVKLKTYMKHITYVRRYFKNKNLQKAFTFQNIYVGQNPYSAPALFAMLPAAELTEGSIFPVGGMFRITEKLLSLAEAEGVKFIYNRPVASIQTEKKQATGVIFQDGTKAEADVIIANADLPYVYRELLPDKAKSKKIDRLRHSCSAIVLHWGLDKSYPQLSHHNVFLSADYKKNLDKIFRDQSLSDNPSFYVHAPVRSDPTAAPAGQDSISVIIPSGHYIDQNGVNWNELKSRARQSVITRLKEIGITDIGEHIKFEICFLPQTWKSIFNLSRGATFGSLGHNIFQMGYFRPHNRHKRYRNLYFTGGSTHPGNGIPLVLLSALLTSERIIKEFPS